MNLSELINFFSPWNDQKTYGFLIISWEIELNQVAWFRDTGFWITSVTSFCISDVFMENLEQIEKKKHRIWLDIDSEPSMQYLSHFSAGFFYPILEIKIC